jgi:hypothetical protein
LLVGQVKEEFHEPRYTWPILKVLKMFTTSEDKLDHDPAILDSLNLSEFFFLHVGWGTKHATLLWEANNFSRQHCKSGHLKK